MPSAEAFALLELLATLPPPGSPYGVPVPGSERPGRTPVIRHWRYRDQPLLERVDSQVRTVHEIFEDTVKSNGNRQGFGWRPWNAKSRALENTFDWMTFNEVAQRRKNLGAGIYELHQRLGVTEAKYGVGIWSKNSPEWQITDLALSSQSLFSVALYETLGPETSEYIINHGELKCIASSLVHIPTLLKLAPRLPTLKIIISLDPLDAGEPTGLTKADLLRGLAKDADIQIFSMAEVETIGARSGQPMRPPREDDILTINYTSGTTGAPKGVVLTHANMVASNASARATTNINPTDAHISYLPLAHIYGRMTDLLAMSAGARIGFFNGDMTTLSDDLKILKPSIFLSVPRLYNRFKTGIETATVDADGIRGALSRHIINTKKSSMRLPPGKATNKHMLYDRIWTPKVRGAVGMENCHVMVTGSAKLDPTVHEFLRAAFGIQFLEGFGMTETSATATVQLPNDFTTGTIGAPVPSCEVCIESCPDLEYNVTDKPNPRGELLVRGPLVFNEYYKNPEETAKTLEADGWFHTGDIAELDNMGRFKIIDRKKNMLKLAQGEYISPERIENVYLGNSRLLATAFVHGDSHESTLVGIFGVEPEHFAPFASKILGKPVNATDLQAIKVAGQDNKVKSAFIKHLDDIGRKYKFNGYERVRKCYLDVEPFTVDNELFTPTLKLKRPQAARAFREQIDQMYAEINAAPGNKAKL